MQGQLVVKPKKAKIQYNTQWLGKMHPFVVLQFEKQKNQTEVCRRENNQPQWNNTLTFTRLSSNLLYIMLIDKQAYKNHDVIGSVQIDISDIFVKTQRVIRWVDVQKQGKISARIQFQFLFQPLKIEQSNFKGNVTGSLMMSKRSKLGKKKQNNYQQYKYPNLQFENQYNNPKPFCYENCNQRYSQSFIKSNIPFQYSGYHNSNNIEKDLRFPQPYLAQPISNNDRIQNSFKKLNVNNNNSQFNKSNKSKTFSAEQMDSFLDD